MAGGMTVTIREDVPRNPSAVALTIASPVVRGSKATPPSATDVRVTLAPGGITTIAVSTGPAATTIRPTVGALDATRTVTPGEPMRTASTELNPPVELPGEPMRTWNGSSISSDVIDVARPIISCTGCQIQMGDVRPVKPAALAANVRVSAIIPSSACTVKFALLLPGGITSTRLSLPSVEMFGASNATPKVSKVRSTRTVSCAACERKTDPERCKPEPMFIPVRPLMLGAVTLTLPVAPATGRSPAMLDRTVATPSAR